MNTCLKGYVTSRFEAYHGKSPLCHVGGYWLCTSGDIKHLNCHVTSQVLEINGSWNFMIGNSLLYVNTLSSLVIMSIVMVEICF